MAAPKHSRASCPRHARVSTPAQHARRGSRWRLLVAPMGGVFLVLALSLVIVGAPGSPHAPSMAPPAQGLDASSSFPAPTCGALGILANLLGECSRPPTPPAVSTAATTHSCNLFQELFGLCGNSGVALLLALEAELRWLGGGSPPTTTTTSTSTTSTSSTTTTSTSSTTTTTVPQNACAGTAPPIAPPSGAWTCTFDDEFSGTALDTTKWQPQLTATSGYSTGDPGHQVCYVDTPSTIAETGGYLHLSVIHTAPQYCKGLDGVGSGTEYEGGMVSSYQIFSQEYGYFQVRAEMPAATERGLQETLWLFPENEKLYGPWPDSGEIDYGEFYSNQSSADFPVVHYPGSTNDPNAQTSAGCTIQGIAPAGQFNTYALSWTPTTITAYFNGVPCITDVYAPYVTSPDTAPAPFDQPFFLAFTAALGVGTDLPTWTTPLPATTALDWVRVWQYG